jgi:hypothetical protein
MAIVRISTTQRNCSVVSVQSCVYGVESEVLEAVDPDNIVMELMGMPEKIAQVVGRTRSRIVTVYGKVPRTD